MSQRSRGSLAALVTLLLSLAVTLVSAAPSTAVPRSVSATSSTATSSTENRLDARIIGWAENSATLPDGDLLVSNLLAGRIERIDRTTGKVSTLVKVPGPGGLVISGDTLYAVVGNSPLSAVTRGGGVVAIDLRTTDVRTLTSGLGEANGLAALPDGDLVFSVTLGAGTGVHRLSPVTGERRLLTTAVPGPNGVAVGPAGQVYVGSTLVGTIYQVSASSGATSKVAGISVFVDDFSVLPDGRIIAATVPGAVDLLDPRTGTSRPYRLGFPGATSAKLSAGEVAVTTATGRVVLIPAP